MPIRNSLKGSNDKDKQCTVTPNIVIPGSQWPCPLLLHLQSCPHTRHTTAANSLAPDSGQSPRQEEPGNCVHMYTEHAAQTIEHQQLTTANAGQSHKCGVHRSCSYKIKKCDTALSPMREDTGSSKVVNFQLWMQQCLTCVVRAILGQILLSKWIERQHLVASTLKSIPDRYRY